MSDPLGRLSDSGYLAPIDRHFAACMVRLCGDRDPAVALGAAMASRAVQRGNVCAELAGLAGGPALTASGEIVEGFCFPDLGAWRAALIASRLVDHEPSQPPRRPLVLDAGDRLYLARYWLYQQGLAAGLLARAGELADDLAPGFLEPALDRLFGPSSRDDPQADQRQAARMACQRRLAVISGGPGTGKTSTVVRIMALLIEQALASGRSLPRFALMAPTGKAAARLAEAVRSALQAQGPGGWPATRRSWTGCPGMPPPFTARWASTRPGPPVLGMAKTIRCRPRWSWWTRPRWSIWP